MKRSVYIVLKLNSFEESFEVVDVLGQRRPIRVDGDDVAGAIGFALIFDDRATAEAHAGAAPILAGEVDR